MSDNASAQPRVALFVTCLVDLLRPSVGFAAIELLERAGCRVEVPRKNRNAALSEYVRRYAQRLQHHALRAPYNWFNFYDFWHPNDAMAAPDPQVSGVLETSRAAGGAAAGGLAARRVT